MTLEPTGCVLLCDHVYADRGKSSILGAGWTQIAAGQTKVAVAIVLNIGRPSAPYELHAVARLATADAADNVLGEATVQAEVVIPDSGDTAAEYQQLIVPASWDVTLVPDTNYVVRLFIGDRLVSAAAFSARASSDRNAAHDR